MELNKPRGGGGELVFKQNVLKKNRVTQKNFCMDRITNKSIY